MNVLYLGNSLLGTPDGGGGVNCLLGWMVGKIVESLGIDDYSYKYEVANGYTLKLHRTSGSDTPDDASAELTAGWPDVFIMQEHIPIRNKVLFASGKTEAGLWHDQMTAGVPVGGRSIYLGVSCAAYDDGTSGTTSEDFDAPDRDTLRKRLVDDQEGLTAWMSGNTWQDVVDDVNGDAGRASQPYPLELLNLGYKYMIPLIDAEPYAGFPTVVDMFRDGTHPDTELFYFQALALAAELYDIDVRGATYSFDAPEGGAQAGLPGPELAAQLQEIVFQVYGHGSGYVKMLDTLRHLLPDSVAWRLVVERTLKKYLRGISSVGRDIVAFTDNVFDDLWPSTTRELTEWMSQFGIDPWAWSNDDDMRGYLDFRWGEDRGQSPKHLQDKLQAAGFDAYVFDSFDHTDISLSSYTGDSRDIFDLIDVGAANPHGFSFGQGGWKLYFAEDLDNTIYEIALPAPYTFVITIDGEERVPEEVGSFVTTTQDGSPFDVQLSSDGTKMFVLGSANAAIYEYDLPTAWSVTGAQYVDSMSVTTKESVPQSFAWKPDGTEVYVTGTGSDDVHQYSLTTAWDISSGGFTRTFDPALSDPVSITFNDDGTSMYLVLLSATLAYQWDLGTAWDISTASAAGHNLQMSSEDSDPFQIVVEGKRLFMLGIGDGGIYRYWLGAWRNPDTYADQPLLGNTQCGDDGSGVNPVAECGEEPDDQTSVDSATCNRLLANDVLYLVNNKLTGGAPPPLPADPAKWGPFWYVGGTPIGTDLELDEHDRQRFEKICLKHGPAEQYIVTIVDRWETTLISSWNHEYDDETLDSGEWQFTTTTTTPVKIHDTDADGTDQSAVLATVASGDKLRFVRPDGGWIEYVTTGAASDQTTYWSIAINTTPTAQSSDWIGFPGVGATIQIYHRESV